MLENLRTKNYAVLADLDLDFKPGLTAITGESGAGKSTLLRALTAPWEGSKNNADGFVESTWNDTEADEASYAVGRLWKGGRSYATTEGMKTGRENLPTEPYLVVRQGAANWLRAPATAREVVDQKSKVIKKYRRQWTAYENAKTAYLDHVNKLNTLNRSGLEETVKVLAPLLASGDAVGDYESLREQETRLKELVENTKGRQHQLSLLGENGEVFDALSQWVNTLDSAEAEAAYETLHHHHQQLLAGEFVTEEELIAVQEQTYRYESLEYQYGAVSEWAEVYGNAENDLKTLSRGEALTAELKAVLRQKKTDLLKVAAELHSERIRLAKTAAKQIIGHLDQLGLADSAFVIEVTRAEKPTANGADVIKLMWNPNRLGLVPVGEGASGGEISRIMLAVQNILHQAGVYIYDEIDSGLSGAALATVGKYLHDQAESAQVIIITHSPVLAAQADQHILLEKSGGKTTAVHVREREREEALLSMLGANVDEAEKAVVMKALSTGRHS